MVTGDGQVMIRQADLLPQSYFNRSTLAVARGLIGQLVVVRNSGSEVAGTIVETEAYIGQEDPACHAAAGRTPRNEAMWGAAGHTYVYFTYGNHWMLNFVTQRTGFPAAVLIRALEPVSGIEDMVRRRGIDDHHRLCRGPGNLTRALGIDKADNGQPLTGGRIGVYRVNGPRPTIDTGGRVGVNEGWEKPWRFFIRDHPSVSAYRMGTKAARQRVKQMRGQ